MTQLTDADRSALRARAPKTNTSASWWVRTEDAAKRKLSDQLDIREKLAEERKAKNYRW